MRGVWICDRDETGALKVDLSDLLTLAGPRAEASWWTASAVEVAGPAGQSLEALADAGGKVSGREFRKMAAAAGQIVDGVFEAYSEQRSSDPWLIIRAVDSSAFDVQTDVEGLLRAIRERYETVQNIPND
jgi:hypothetical protein